MPRLGDGGSSGSAGAPANGDTRATAGCSPLAALEGLRAAVSAAAAAAAFGCERGTFPAGDATLTAGSAAEPPLAVGTRSPRCLLLPTALVAGLACGGSWLAPGGANSAESCLASTELRGCWRPSASCGCAGDGVGGFAAVAGTPSCRAAETSAAGMLAAVPFSGRSSKATTRAMHKLSG